MSAGPDPMMMTLAWMGAGMFALFNPGRVASGSGRRVAP
jgi:hypothetical protein